MATKITITADANQAKSELGAVANALDNVGDQAKQTATEAKSAAAAVENIASANTAQKVTATGVSFLSLAKAMELAKKAGELLSRGISFLADQGSPAFARLSAAIGETQRKLIELADSPAVQQITDRIAAGIGKATDSILSLPDVWEQSITSSRAKVMELLESLNVSTEQWRKNLSEIEAAEGRAAAEAEKRIASERTALEIQKQTDALKKSLADFDAQRVAKRRQDALAEINDEDEIRDRMRLRRKEMQDLAAQGGLTDNLHKTFLQSMVEMEGRLQEIRRDSAAESKRQADEQKQRDAEVAESHRKMIEDQRASEIEANAAREADRQAEIERQKQALAGTGSAEAINRQAIDPQAIARQLAEQAAQAKMTDIYQSGGDVDAAANKRAISEARAAAHRAAIMQSRGGKEVFSQEQISDAINANASAGIQAMQQTGQFSQESLTALSESAAEQRKMATEMRAMQDQLAEIRRFQAGTSKDGERRRSQRNSSRQ